MTTEAQAPNRLNEQSIGEAAAAALRGLELDAGVESVRAESDRWCVQFTTEYSQFCDTFRDQFGRENSFELVREKIKRHILKQQQNKIRSNVKIRRGKPQQQPRAATDTLLDTALKTIEGIAGQTAITAREIIDRAARLPEQALTMLASAAAETASPILEEARMLSATDGQTLSRVTVKADAGGKSTRKRSAPASKKASKTRATTGKARSTSKKSAAVSKKSTAAKSTSGPTRKRSPTKRSARQE